MPRDKSTPSTAPFFTRFDLDIPRAVAGQLGECLDRLTPLPLNSPQLGEVPTEPGVYRLHKDGRAVYVGKADNLRSRLAQHAGDLDGRQNISRADLSFVCATLSKNWATFGAEDVLMKSGTYAWQNTGFGNNDPGRERDTSKLDAGHWDLQYPIRFDWPCADIAAGEYSAAGLLDRLKKTLPFLLRVEKRSPGGKGGHKLQVIETRVQVPRASMPFRELFEIVVRTLPGWQGTIFPGYVILYEERETYREAVFTFVA